jgi:hypothetical protein
MITRRTKRLAALAAVAIAVVAAVAVPAGAVTPSPATKVARVTGATPSGETIPNPNHTDTAYQVNATDLGIMWDAGGGKLMVAFGDTFGAGWTGPGAPGGGTDWRSNVLGISTNTDPQNGLKFSTMIQNTTGHAKELLSSLKIDNNEITVIPTAGITIGTRSYIHFMSVNHWGSPGSWVTNYSEMAYSDDGGQNWTKDVNTRWSASSNFAQAAFIRNGGYLYMYGTPAGRLGNAYLARVPEANVLSKTSYQYWDGNAWQTNNESAAVPIVKGPVSELSVQYNSHFGRYLMVYLGSRVSIVLRDAGSLTGTWTGERQMATSSTYPGLYGAFIHPWFNTSTDLYFTMAQWDPYNVFFMHSTLSTDSLGENLLSDPGFEDQTTNTVSVPWQLTGTGGIDRGLGNGHSGANNAWLRSSSGTNTATQTIAVAPNHMYRLTGWVRTSANMNNGTLGVRGVNGGAVIQQTAFGAHTTYAQVTVNFNSGANSLIDVYGGFTPPGADAWVQLDDLAVVPTTTGEHVGDGGFESQTTNTPTAPWGAEGPDSKGVDRGLGFTHTGANNGWVRTSSTSWNAITQVISVTPSTNYTLTGWLTGSSNVAGGFFGVRTTGGTVISEAAFGSLPSYTQKTVSFNSGSNTSVIVYAGFWGPGADSWIRVDDVSVQ